MTCRRLRPRIEFLPPEKKDKTLSHPLRDTIEEYEDRHQKFDDWKKAQVQKAMKKQEEEGQKRVRKVFNFFVWAHVLIGIEIIILKSAGIL